MRYQKSEVKVIHCRWCRAPVPVELYTQHLEHCPKYQRWLKRHLGKEIKVIS